MQLHIGIDGGVTGAIACHYEDGQLVLHPVSFRNLGGERILDIPANLAFIRKAVSTATDVLVAYEQMTKQPLFGANGNFANGRNNEFWRVLLSMESLPFLAVRPQVWQREIFAGMSGRDTKAKARLVVDQRFPHLDLRDFTKSQAGGVIDALCISEWVRRRAVHRSTADFAQAF